MEAAKEMKSFLHDEGIHSTTIQPEFPDVSVYYRYRKEISELLYLSV